MGSEYILMPNGELYHWGIKGQKWGVRRYQNKDGSLTDAGRKRYNDEAAALKEREKTIKNRERVKARQAKLDAKKAELDEREKALDAEDAALKSGKKGKNAKAAPEQPKQKSVKDMTDEELNQAIQRARMEDVYKQLRPDPKPEPKLSERIMKEVVGPAAMNSGKKALEAMLDKAVKNALADKVDPNSLEALKKTAEKLKLQRDIEKYRNGEDPNEKPLSWEDRTKKYHLEKEMAEDQAKREKAEREAAEKKAKSDKADNPPKTDKSNKAEKPPKTDKTDKQTKTTKADKQSDADRYTVEGKGSSRYNWSNDDGPEYTVDYEFVSGNSSSRSVSNTAYADSGRNYIAGLLSDPTNNDTYNRSSAYIDSGRNYIAGLLPAPKDDD